MKKYNVAILGATGAVGLEMLKIMDERKFPINTLTLLASSKSAGQKILYQDKEIVVKEATKDSFKGIDIVLGAADTNIAKKLLPYAVQAGALVIDNSSAYRLEPDVPLVIPEVNPDDIFTHKGIIANPNCATIIALVAVQKLHQYAKIKAMHISTYQAVSGAGKAGIDELNKQISDIENGKTVTCQAFPYQIAFNVIPQIGTFDENGYSSEEMKMQNEGRKILHNNDLKVTCTCVRIPVYRSHCESITIHFENPIDTETARALLADAEGVKLVDDIQNQIYPMPLDASDQDLVHVGRIRKDLCDDSGKSLTLWCCGDQIRKGAATNAVQIALAYIQKT